jgi:hypothetical protein
VAPINVNKLKYGGRAVPQLIPYCSGRAGIGISVPEGP